MAITGRSEDDFWSSTPRQTFRAIKAAEERALADEQNRRWHSWHIAGLPLFDKFPALDKFVAPANAPPARRQTMDEQIAVLRQWSAISRAMGENARRG